MVIFNSYVKLPEGNPYELPIFNPYERRGAAAVSGRSALWGD